MTEEIGAAKYSKNRWPVPGMRYGYLVVMRRGADDRTGHQRFWCKCDCGKRKLIRADYLANGRTSSCGHFRRREKIYEDYRAYRCVETGEVFKTMIDILQYLGFDNSYYGKIRYAVRAGTTLGVHPETGIPLHWEEYIDQREVKRKPPRVHDKRWADGRSRKVVLLNTGEIFNSVSNANRAYPQAHITHISACCRGRIQSAGKDIFGEPLIWMYYEDWIGKGLEFSD